MVPRRTAVSLFTSGGVGDLALRAAGFDVLVSNELREDRHAVFARNFPNSTALTGDVWELRSRIRDASLEALGGRVLDLFYATPPCQGMSKNGRGKLLNAIRAGQKPPADERNRLIIPTMDVACALSPETVLLENVPEMAETVIVDENSDAVPIVEYVRRRLGDQYVGAAEVVEFANYGVPQRRQRLITVFTRSPELVRSFRRLGTFLPPATHSSNPISGELPWVTVRDAIADLPPLDARSKSVASSKLEYHRVPVLDEMKYWWVSNTPPGCGAFDNQCVSCGFNGNPLHSAKRNAAGVNRASVSTPIDCVRCGALLPRPSVCKGDRRVLMRGFTSAYRRMVYDQPASALTRNLSYACSDKKLHPEQHRVLSLLEAFRIHSLDEFEYEWARADGKRLSDKTVREIIGESIPPKGLLVILKELTRALSSAVPGRGQSRGPARSSAGRGRSRTADGRA